MIRQRAISRPSLPALRLCCSLFLLPPSCSLMYDVVEPSMSAPAACALGCAPWADAASGHNTQPQASVDALWASRAAQAAAGNACAMPAHFAGQPEDSDFDFSYGPQCLCAGSAAAPTSASGYCGPPAVPTPQQVSLQVGASVLDLSVSFVTFNGGAAAGAPVVELCVGGGGGGGGACANATGATTVAPAPQDAGKLYSFHLVALPALAASTDYTYRVFGGAGAWRGPFALRTAPAHGQTVIAMAGDLGVYEYNCFGNLLQDLSGPAAAIPAAFIHLGDHAYNMAMGGGERGEGESGAAAAVYARGS
jgi:hypothetical protein